MLRSGLPRREEVATDRASKFVPIAVGELARLAPHNGGSRVRCTLLLILSCEIALKLGALLRVIPLVHIKDELARVDRLDKPLQLSIVRM